MIVINSYFEEEVKMKKSVHSKIIHICNLNRAVTCGFMYALLVSHMWVCIEAWILKRILWHK